MRLGVFLLPWVVPRGIAVLAVSLLSIAAAEASLPPTFAPESDFVYRLEFPDGGSRLFFRPDADDDNLIGEDSWSATLLRRAAVVKSPQGKRPQETFYFENGLLKDLVFNGRHVAYSPTGTVVEATFDGLFRDTPVSDKEIDVQRSALWRESGRLRFLYGNPNKTAVPFVYVFVFGIILLFSRSTSCSLSVRIVGAVCVVTSSVCVALTHSRGGMLAAAVAGSFVTVAQLFGRRRSRWLGFMALAFIVAVALTAASFGPVRRALDRKIASDVGLQHRIAVLRAVPRMIVDAPDGWGLGRSGAAYINWYQDKAIVYPRRTLVSSHATILAECGWFIRLAYMFVWAFALTVLLDAASRGKSSFALGCCIAFGVAAGCNPVAEEWALWAVPTAFVVFAILKFVKERGVRGVTIHLSLALGVVGAMAAALYGIGSRPCDEVEVKFADGRLKVNGDTPDAWILADDVVLGGEQFTGRCARRYYEENPDAPAIGMVWSIDDLPKETDRLILAGRKVLDYMDRWRDSTKRDGVCKAKSMLLLSPACSVVDIPEDLMATVRLRAVAGSLAVLRLPPDRRQMPDWMRVIPGVSVYIPEWTRTSLNF